MRWSAVALQWWLAGAGIALWAAGQAVYTYFDVRHFPETTALSSDLYFFLFGVPFLLAISSVEGQQHTKSLLLIDSLQAIIVCLLVRTELFPASEAARAISVAHVSMAYNLENLLLTAGVGLRLLAGARGEQRHFYRLIFLFLALYTAVALPLNYLNFEKGLPTGTYFDLLWDLPFLTLAALSLATDVKTDGSSSIVVSRFQQVLVHSMPVLITATVLVMGTILVRHHFEAGLISVLIGLAGYSIRNTLLEMRYVDTQTRLSQSETALQQAMQRFQELSYIDPLTKVANRRQFEETLTREWYRAMRRTAPLTLLMLDLDHFKLLNDTYGHLRGDECLMISARILSSRLKRAGELLARYGGEEFAAVLPDVTLEEALRIAETLRAAIEGIDIANKQSPNGGRLTISVGVAACYPTPNLSMEQLVDTADQALYAAKQAGRNRVHSARLVDPRVQSIVQQINEASIEIEQDPQGS
jgi:diguanylate cyclase (GGDEF)-like protein